VLNPAFAQADSASPGLLDIEIRRQVIVLLLHPAFAYLLKWSAEQVGR
jgi:hypothetical protein